MSTAALPTLELVLRNFKKITWDKLTEDTPMFVIESDATIVAPLVLSSALLECKRHPDEAKALIARHMK